MCLTDSSGYPASVTEGHGQPPSVQRDRVSLPVGQRDRASLLVAERDRVSLPVQINIRYNKLRYTNAAILWGRIHCLFERRTHRTHPV